MINENIMFQKHIFNYAWVQHEDERDFGKAMMDYMVVSNQIIWMLLDVRVLRRERGGVLEGELRVGIKWIRSQRGRCVKEALRVREFGKNEGTL